MPWTEADRENVLEAMREIAAGERMVTLTTADRVETRQVFSLEDLQKLLNMIDGATTAPSQRPRILRSRYSKGL